MLHRPLISVLVSFIGGILFGHIIRDARAFIFPFLVIFTSLLLASIFIPRPFRSFIMGGLFFFTGVLFILNTHHESDLLQWVHEKENIIIEGTVIQPMRIDGDIARVDIMTERVIRDGKSLHLKEKIFATIYNHPQIFSPGDRIRFPAKLRPFRNFNNPGRYNYSLSMSLKGYCCSASVSDGRYIVPMGKGRLGFPWAVVEQCRRPIRQFFTEKLSARNQAVLSALILGERQNISPDLREPFNVTGLGHILAVSGLHIGLIAWLSFGIFKRLFSFSHYWMLKIDIRKAAAVTTCIPVVIYTFLAGFQVSSQRAMIMVLAFLFSIILEREKEMWSTLALASLIILALDPTALFSISFQLSFLAVVGILWLAPPVQSLVPKLFQQDEQKFLYSHLYSYGIGMIVVTFSAVLFLLPVTSFYFHRIPMISIPANLTTVPILGFWVLPLGLLSGILAHIIPSIAYVFLQLTSWGLDGMMAVIQFWARLQWASFWVVTPNMFEIILFYGLLFTIFFFKVRRWAKIGFCFIVIAVLMDISYWTYKTQFNRHLIITYFDVGQGNAALVQFPGNQRMLIDGGGFHVGHFDVGGMVVAPALWYAKINRIDYLVLTHPQSDHMNGLCFIAANFKPKEFWYNGDRVETQTFQNLLKILETKKIKISQPLDLSNGKDISGVHIEIFNPPVNSESITGYYNSRDLNNRSLVLKLSYRGRSALFPGDLEDSGEQKVVENFGDALQSDILLAPHHGSKTSCSNAFLKSVNPDLCVISSGSGNFFGFPHAATIQRLNEFGTQITRIDKVGATRISIDEKGWKIKTFLGKEASQMEKVGGSL
ncbi:MAG: DNA internalization-related competence protein ComEC/Rec2 [Deltaproteobacteria bacterium]|nr:DNA internalization-related competence protein ComEC/Rec2 [Deltaproteobacteria bacterium]